jgi:hypothetical protein
MADESTPGDVAASISEIHELLLGTETIQEFLADASALDVLTGIHRRATVAGKVFLVVAPDPQARETMRVTGLDRTLLVFPTVADFHTWNRGSGSQPDGGGILTCG